MSSVAMQRAVNKIKGEMFSMWFSYSYCWATNVFSMGPSRDYISSPVVNQGSIVEREREWSNPSAVQEDGFG
jgi:hypothetical protein